MVETQRRRKSRTELFYAERKEWVRPDIVLNPLGTVVTRDGKEWVCKPWAEEFFKELGARFFRPVRLMVSVPWNMEEAGYWDLVLLQAGLDKAMASLCYETQNQRNGLGSYATIQSIGYPPTIECDVYIDCLPQRILNTLVREGVSKPKRIVYWRPGDREIEVMGRYGIDWNDREEELIEHDLVIFAGSPEDVISALGF